jgi:hypothetical protein
MLSTILLIVLVLLVLGSVPVWPYSREWGYVPSGLLSLLLVILLVYMFFFAAAVTTVAVPAATTPAPVVTPPSVGTTPTP